MDVIVKIIMRIFKMKNLINNEKKKFRSGTRKKYLNTKGKVNLNTKGKVNLNGFEVIQTIHCSYQLGEFCRS